MWKRCNIFPIMQIYMNKLTIKLSFYGVYTHRMQTPCWSMRPLWMHMTMLRIMPFIGIRFFKTINGSTIILNNIAIILASLAHFELYIDDKFTKSLMALLSALPNCYRSPCFSYIKHKLSFFFLYRIYTLQSFWH